MTTNRRTIISDNNKLLYNVIKYISDKGIVTIQVVSSNGIVYTNNQIIADIRNKKYSNINENNSVEFIGIFNTTKKEIKDYADILATYIDMENLIISELYNTTNKYNDIKCSIKDINNKIQIYLNIDGDIRVWRTDNLHRLKSIIVNEIIDKERTK